MAALALLCSAALMRGAWPRLGAPTVSLASAPPPLQPLLPARQCNAHDGSIARDGMPLDASLPCNWGLSAVAAATPSASCSGAELLAAIGGKESVDDLPKCAKELTLKQGAPRAEELADFGAFFRAPPAVPYFAHGAQFAAARAALRSTPKAKCQWMLELVEAGHLKATCYLGLIWRYVLHGAAEADKVAAVVAREKMPLDLSEARLVRRARANSKGPESRSFARGGGCPLQWLPMFYAVVGTPSPPPPSTTSPTAQPLTSPPDPQSPSPPSPPSPPRSPYIRASPAPSAHSPAAAIGTEVEGMRALSESGCTDRDGGATGTDGGGCSVYTHAPGWCGGYDDTDFTSSTMCCACGGGAAPPSLPPSPPSPPSPPHAPPSPPSPPVPPLHPPLEGTATGPCVLDLTTNCVCSSNFAATGACAATSTTDGQYSNSESCRVAFAQPVLLHIHLFDTEAGYDMLTVDPSTGGTVYSGTDGPDGVEASVLSWSSDGSVTSGGFKVCFTNRSPSPPSPLSPPAPAVEICSSYASRVMSSPARLGTQRIVARSTPRRAAPMADGGRGCASHAAAPSSARHPRTCAARE